MFKRAMLALLLSLVPFGSAHAICGDVNGDLQRSASDALAVLRASVGLNVNFQCVCDDDCTPASTLPPTTTTTTTTLPVECNPVANTGCSAGQKCTWIEYDEEIGALGCVPDGTAAIGEACSRGAPGETTGYDNCVGGNICIASVCQAICTIAQDDCAENTTCGAYAGLFGDPAVYGACDFQCDPVTQQRLFDNAENCGVGDGSRACYMLFDDEKGFCAPVPQAVRANLTEYQQGDTAYGPLAGGAFPNGCAPGYGPLLRSANDGAAPVICLAYCRPAETHSGAPEGAGGTSPYSCTDRGALTQECKYLWYFEDTPSSAHDGFGFCWTPEDYIANWDNTGGTEPHPRCTTLANTDTNADGVPEHTNYGCSPAP